jgi:hypothetical protein
MSIEAQRWHMRQVAMLGVHRRACRCHKRPRPLVGEETLSRAHRRRPQPDVHLLACLATGGARALYSIRRMLGLTPMYVSPVVLPAHLLHDRVHEHDGHLHIHVVRTSSINQLSKLDTHGRQAKQLSCAYQHWRI